eukprot:SAG22_NODE_10366_length_539_cov_0.975000_1_plen_76_part_00
MQELSAVDPLRRRRRRRRRRGRRRRRADATTVDPPRTVTDPSGRRQGAGNVFHAQLERTSQEQLLCLDCVSLVDT